MFRTHRNIRARLSVFLLTLTLVFGLVTTIGIPTASAHAASSLTPHYTCVVTLTPVDKAPGNWWQEHQKFLFAYGVSTDVTQLFSNGQAYISYSDQNYNILGEFDRNSYWIGVQGFNQWGLRTRWTWFNQGFTSYHWLALWNC